MKQTAREIPQMGSKEGTHRALVTVSFPRFSVLATVTVLLSLYPLTGYLYLPALPLLRQTFAASVESTQWTLSAFVAGFGLTQLVWGSMGDRYGRRPVLLFGLGAFIAGVIGCLIATNIFQVVAWRALQGVGVAASAVCARALLRDLYQPSESVRMLSIGLTGLSALGIAAPICGATIITFRGAAGSFEVLAAIGAATLAYIALAVPETVAALQSDRISQHPTHALLRIARHRLFCAYTALMACTYAGHYLFLIGSSFLLIERGGLSVFAYGVVLSLGSLVHLAGTIACRWWLKIHSVQATVAHAAALTFFSGVAMGLLSLCGIDAAWALVVPHWLYLFAHAVHQSCGQAAVMAPFPECAGTATGLSGTIVPFIAVSAAWMLSGPLSQRAIALPLSLCAFAVLTALVAWTLVQWHGAIQED